MQQVCTFKPVLVQNKKTPTICERSTGFVTFDMQGAKSELAVATSNN